MRRKQKGKKQAGRKGEPLATSAEPKGEQKKVWTPDKGKIHLMSDVDQPKLRKGKYGPA